MEYRLKRSITIWRKSLSYETLIRTLILFELVLSVIFSLVGHLLNSIYLRGIGIGLIISWVTSALAYLYRKRALRGEKTK